MTIERAEAASWRSSTADRRRSRSTTANIELEFDTRDGGGQLLSYQLNGRIEGDGLGGVLTPPLNAPQGTWRATRHVVPPPAPPKPVDFTGVWSRTSSGLARVTLDYTPAAQSAVDAYHYLDDPSLRCVSPGLVRVSGWPYPLEIVQNDTQVTILYESFHEVRRIFLDGRGYPEKLPHRAMGYSLGHWEGSTLVVETKMLTPGYVDLAGQPLSENSRVVERMSLSADGQVLRSELTVYDPENYRRPITRHRAWRESRDLRSSSTTAIPIRSFAGSRSRASSSSTGSGCGAAVARRRPAGAQSSSRWTGFSCPAVNVRGFPCCGSGAG